MSYFIFNDVYVTPQLTLSPTSRSLTGAVISIDPREILVGIARAWKKAVFSGPNPVFCGGTVTSTGAMAPDRAEA